MGTSILFRIKICINGRTLAIILFFAPFPPRIMKTRPLSDRELACLQWSSQGMTSRETARILGLSERTVNFHLQNACGKLAVRGRRAAVVQAVWRGLLKAPCADEAIAGTPAPAPRETAPKDR